MDRRTSFLCVSSLPEVYIAVLVFCVAGWSYTQASRGMMAFLSDEDRGGGGADPLMLGPYIDIAVSVIVGLL